MMMMMFTTISARNSKARRGDGEYGRLYEGAEGHNSQRQDTELVPWGVLMNNYYCSALRRTPFAGNRTER